MDAFLLEQFRRANQAFRLLSRESRRACKLDGSGADLGRRAVHYLELAERIGRWLDEGRAAELKQHREEAPVLQCAGRHGV